MILETALQRVLVTKVSRVNKKLEYAPLKLEPLNALGADFVTGVYIFQSQIQIFQGKVYGTE